MPTRRKQIFLVSLLLLLLTLFFLHPVYDPDFWWHLKSGQLIWEGRAIPGQDLLSFTTYEGVVSAQQQMRIRYIVTQYWLSQPALYLLWKWFGPTGIILMRTLILLLSVGTALRFMLRRGTDLTIALSLSALAGVHLAIFTGERPQLFSFLFSALYLYGLEILRTEQGSGRNNRALYVLLPVLTLAWANMHASALVAWLIGIPYLVNAIVIYWKYPDRRTGTRPAILTIGASLCVTLINPNTYQGLVLTFELFQSKHLQQNTEFMSPFKQMSDMRLFYPGYLILMIVSIVMLFSRQAPLLVKAVTVMLLLMSIRSMRFTPFFVLLAPMLFAPWLQTFLHRKKFFANEVFCSLALLVCMLQFYQNREEILTFGVNEKDYPRSAVRFIRDSGIHGRMFNLFEWGGYLMWHLPEEKTFIDGRVLRLDVYDDYDIIIEPSPAQPTWKPLLEKHQIDFTVISVVNTDLVYLLLNDSDWSPVYSDEIAVVFMRNPGRLSVVLGSKVLQDIITALNRLVADDPENSTWLKRLASAYYRQKDRPNALLYYQKALALHPDDPFLQQMTNLLQLKQ